MAKIDRLKEEIGWLKVVFGVLVAIDASLLGWLAQSYGTASRLLVLNQTTEDSYTSSLAVEPLPFGRSVAKRSRRPANP
jgi:hypothetical protein